MIIFKIINNNVVSSLNEFEEETVIMGRGIGYNKSPGDTIDETKIEKTFESTERSTTSQYKKLVASIPYEHMQVANEIISYAKRSLHKRLNDNIYVALTDHLSYAIVRYENGIKFKNSLLWEIKRFYNHEFLIGKEALEIINKRLNVELEEDEAGFIALHIVNAELDTDMEHSLTMTKIIQDIMNIVKYHFNIVFDENSLAYERFITHLKFFAQRVISDETYDEEEAALYQMIRQQYPEAFQCVEKIKDYVIETLEYELSDAEEVYLAIHINRISLTK